MRIKENRLVVSFHTTTEAVAMEMACKNQGISGRLIPLPSAVSAGCGLAFSAPEKEADEILKFMEEEGLSYEAAGVYYI